MSNQWIFWKELLLLLIGLCGGMLISGGVFTVLTTVGLTTRFAGKTKTTKQVIHYENFIMYGTIFGCFVSIYLDRIHVWMSFLWETIDKNIMFIIINAFQILYGLFSGVFVGCLALAIAEMLDAIPIFSRRINFREGLRYVIYGLAAGKVVGSFFYFAAHMYFTEN